MNGLLIYLYSLLLYFLGFLLSNHLYFMSCFDLFCCVLFSSLKILIFWSNDNKKHRCLSDLFVCNMCETEHQDQGRWDFHILFFWWNIIYYGSWIFHYYLFSLTYSILKSYKRNGHFDFTFFILSLFLSQYIILI